MDGCVWICLASAAARWRDIWYERLCRWGGGCPTTVETFLLEGGQEASQRRVVGFWVLIGLRVG